MQSERSIKDQIRLELTQQHGARLFVNTVGHAWFGRFRRKIGEIVELIGGRRYPVGLHEGSPDLIGWLPIIVTKEMVGRKIAIFVGIETKTESGKHREQQKHFLATLEADGALSGTARSVEDAIQIINGGNHVR